VKRLLPILATLLLCVSWASAATFTAVTGGDWQSTSTWGTSGSGCHVAYPCMTDTYSGGPANGDNVNLAGYAVTCTGSNEVCTAGSSGTTASSCTAGTAAVVNTTGSGGLTIGSSATFVYAGPVCLPFGTITIQAGAKIYHDSSWASTPTAYVFTDNNGSGAHSVWAAGTIGSSRIVWEGDSFNSPNKYSGNCTSANSAGCRAGQVGGTASGESGEGNLYNLTIQNVGGTGNAWLSYVINGTALNISGLVMTNSGALSVRTGGNKAVTIDKSKFTSTTNTTACLYLGVLAGSSTVTITNTVIECPISPNATYTALTWRNVICSTTWSSGAFYTAGTANLRPCLIGSSDSATHDQVLYYFDGWNSTTSENTLSKGNIGATHLTNSIVWVPHNNLPGWSHVHATQQVWNGLTGGTWNQNNNVYGSFGDTGVAATEGHQTGGTIGGNPTVATTLACTGNVNLCGFAGRGSMTANCTFFSLTSTPNFGADSVTVTNNTYCASAASLSTSAQGDGSAAAEAGTLSANMVVLGANTFFRNDGLGAGAVPEIFDSSANSAYVTNPPWHKILFNAVLNVDSGEVSSAPCGTYGGNCSWINTSYRPTASTELILANQAPGMLDPARSVPLFSEYLDASGLYPVSNYTGASQYRGQWAATTSYSVGDIVYYQASGVYGNRKTYWICKIAHTSASTNTPIVGADSSNPFMGPTPYWEDAWLSMWMKPAILAGTAYYDGALPALYGSSPMYAVGLLNAWLRQGFINTSPALWGGKSAAPGCSADGGVTFTECGAVPLAIVRHIPPPAAVN